LQKKYRKQALLVHPDKCKDPKANEAFKLLTEAFDTLREVLSQENYLRQLQTETISKSRSSKKKSTNVPKKRYRSKKQKPKESPRKRQTYNWSYESWNQKENKKRKKSEEINCPNCKKTFQSEELLKKHLFFGDLNHRHDEPSFSQPPFDPNENIFVE